MKNQTRIALFANPNGDNDHLLTFLETIAKDTQAEFQVISLAERLAEYTNFPSPNRKKRLEEILGNAAKATTNSISDKITGLGLTCADGEVINGRFPEGVEKWLETHNPDLLVKQSLPCDGEFGHVSKGDIRLSRHVPVPLMLLNAALQKNQTVMVGVPPLFTDKSGLSRAVRIVKHSVDWAKQFEAKLVFVHAWHLFGESLLRSRTPQDEMADELQKAKEAAQNEINTALDESRIPAEMEFEVRLHKGDPTRVLLAEVELIKPTLVVMGSVANEGVKGALLGNTAETLIKRKLTNTLIIK